MGSVDLKKDLKKQIVFWISVDEVASGPRIGPFSKARGLPRASAIRLGRTSDVGTIPLIPREREFKTGQAAVGEVASLDRWRGQKTPEPG